MTDFAITRVSIAADGTPANFPSITPVLSADGRYVVFASDADNLVAGDTNGIQDIFLHDLQTRTTSLVSVASDQTPANHPSVLPSISADGRYVAFASVANNLVSGDTNNSLDVFVRDRQTAVTRRISVAADGTEGNNYSLSPLLSADGNYLIFSSDASNLVAGDVNGFNDVFLHELATGTTTAISKSLEGLPGNGHSVGSSISADGRYIAFSSYADNLVSGDTNGHIDSFVYDRLTGITDLISVASDGSLGNEYSQFPSISTDGRYVAFSSFADNLVPDDTNGAIDAFLRDRLTGTTHRVSVATDGTQSNESAFYPVISGDGRFVVFSSSATNLVAADTNNVSDIFLSDLLTGTTNRVSVAPNGSQANGYSVEASISGDGNFVTFRSVADNFVSADINGFEDIFVVPTSGAPVPSPEPVPEPSPEPEPPTESPTEPGPSPIPTPDPSAEPVPEPSPEPEPPTESPTEPGPSPIPAPEPDPSPEPEPTPVPTPEPPAPEPDPSPEPEPTPEPPAPVPPSPEPEPTPEPVPSPEPITGTSGDDRLEGGDDSNFFIGFDGKDTLTGGRGQDFLLGFEGDDRLKGNEGDDVLSGQEGLDRLSGNDGRDIVNGGAGDDILRGGKDADRFGFGEIIVGLEHLTFKELGVDRIRDFVPGVDRITLKTSTFSTLVGDFESLLPAEFASVSSGSDTQTAAIVYHQFTGQLYYNPNGSVPGWGEGGVFAILDDSPRLTATDFAIELS